MQGQILQPQFAKFVNKSGSKFRNKFLRLIFNVISKTMGNIHNVNVKFQYEIANYETSF